MRLNKFTRRPDRSEPADEELPLKGFARTLCKCKKWIEVETNGHGELVEFDVGTRRIHKRTAACEVLPKVVRGRRLTVVIEPNEDICGVCGKVAYKSRAAAKQGAGSNMRRGRHRMLPYLSERCGCWHLTRKVQKP